MRSVSDSRAVWCLVAVLLVVCAPPAGADGEGTILRGDGAKSSGEAAVGSSSPRDNQEKTAVEPEKPVAADLTDRDAIAERIAPMLLEPPVTGLLVFGVVPGSQAEKADFRVGDIVTVYDGQPIAELSDIQRLARAAAEQKRGGLLVLAQRGDQSIEAQFDPAPLGLHLLPIQKGVRRVLWRPATTASLDERGLRAKLRQPHEWQIIEHHGRPVGWSHGYLSAANQRWSWRVQTLLDQAPFDVRRDVAVSFVADGVLSPTALRLWSRDRLILDVRRESGEWRGTRTGVAVTAPAPADTVSTHLAGLLAATMPQQPRACVRCSLLEDASLSAAPFADLYCHGRQNLDGGKKQIACFHYELAAFGKTVCAFWVDEKRQLLRTQIGPDLFAVRATREEVVTRFGAIEKAFDPIDAAPRADALQAN